MIVRHRNTRGALRALLALILAQATSAYAQTPPQTTPASPDTTSPATAEHISEPHTPEVYPQLTPDEAGKRFLKLIDSLKKIDDLSVERIERTMQITMRPTSEKDQQRFTRQLADSGWQYSVDYVFKPRSGKKGLFLEFTNASTNSDMTPVCGMDFAAYAQALEAMGFTLGTPQFVEAEGKLMVLPVYTRDDVLAALEAKPEADSPKSKREHACLRFIGITRAEQ